MLSVRIASTRPAVRDPSKIGRRRTRSADSHHFWHGSGMGGYPLRDEVGARCVIIEADDTFAQCIGGGPRNARPVEVGLLASGREVALAKPGRVNNC